MIVYITDFKGTTQQITDVRCVVVQDNKHDGVVTVIENNDEPKLLNEIKITIPKR